MQGDPRPCGGLWPISGRRAMAASSAFRIRGEPLDQIAAGARGSAFEQDDPVVRAKVMIIGVARHIEASPGAEAVRQMDLEEAPALDPAGGEVSPFLGRRGGDVGVEMAADAGRWLEARVEDIVL